MLPLWFYLSVAAVFGLVIGSFLNVVIYRFHTGRSLNDRSHCLSCGQTLHWYELFPVFSYLALRGRCRSCFSFIPYRYALVEILTAGLFVLAYLHATGPIMFFLLLVLISTLVVGVVYDLYHMIIPDEISALSAVLALLIVLESGFALAFKTGNWMSLMTLLGSAILSGLLLSVVYASLWYFSRGRWFGLGDAKLAFSLGMLVGLGGLFSLFTLSFWIGAVISVALLALSALSTKMSSGKGLFKIPRVKIKSEVPFAPFLVAAFVLVYFFGADVLASMTRVIELFI